MAGLCCINKTLVKQKKVTREKTIKAHSLCFCGARYTCQIVYFRINAIPKTETLEYVIDCTFVDLLVRKSEKGKYGGASKTVNLKLLLIGGKLATLTQKNSNLIVFFFTRPNWTLHSALQTTSLRPNIVQKPAVQFDTATNQRFRSSELKCLSQSKSCLHCISSCDDESIL